ncbi:tripartite tricarboxylate transporter TctB family protein [Acidaminobacter hydrogenoformans]|uniref:Tripartite tricarboxylate transporter TctB family protein n=1 Tax=Acidaminobacter hydrogenoformans DSM 2784 TaxID=1120920 RepID=A0A1G5RZT9_9FIRM|nr:tripartite tricarboxylate transporter TctB family protein [Acidaminobacter hydrogenoformans]SCZ79378.1 Tripartite tricarboxylate transporter TctB family protein [Acidaminobacter hydrogenoformans DSM 2784]
MEIIFNVIIAIFMIAYLFLAAQFNVTTVTGDIVGAGGYPKVLAILGLLLLLIISFNVMKNKNTIRIPMLDLKSKDGKAVLLNVVMLTGYLIMMNTIGFLLSTPLYLFGSTRLMGYKKYVPLLIYTAILSTVLVVIFGKVFYVPLPRGIGIFRELSYSFY